MEAKNIRLEKSGPKAANKVSKALEAARRLKGSIIVNDPTLYIH